MNTSSAVSGLANRKRRPRTGHVTILASFRHTLSQIKEMFVLSACLLLALFLIAPINVEQAAPQGVQPTAKPTPATKLSALLTREGSLVASRYIAVGEMVSGSSTLNFEAVAMWEVGKESVVTKGAVVKIRDVRGATSNLAMLDEDELSGLIKALEQMKQIITSVKNPTSSDRPRAIEETSVTFRTRGNFFVTIFGNPNGFAASCSIDDIPRVSIGFSSARLDELGSFARAAQLAAQTK